MATGCAGRKTASAHLVVPPECVDKITLVKPLDLRPDGSAKTGTFSVKYHCTRVKK